VRERLSRSVTFRGRGPLWIPFVDAIVQPHYFVDDREIAIRPHQGERTGPEHECDRGHPDAVAPCDTAVVGMAQHDRASERQVVLLAKPHTVNPAAVRAPGEGVHGDPVFVVPNRNDDWAGRVLLQEDRLTPRESPSSERWTATALWQSLRLNTTACA
jgi:hypothetical protein